MLMMCRFWQKFMQVWVALLMLVCFGAPSLAMTEMTDENLDGVVGQSLFTSNTASNAGFTFYRLGMDVEMLLNVNVNRLALGCDGVGGTGPCDIELNRLRLAGIGATGSGDTGPATDFMMRRPFLEFAIKNDALATREVSGFRIGSMESLGSMTIGENPVTNNLADDTGIVTLSGDMTVNVINATFTNVRACIGFLVSGVCIGGWINGSANVASHSQLLTLNRATVLPDLGPMTAQASGSLLGLTLTNTYLTGEPIRAIHRIDVQDTLGNPTKDFYISMQKEPILWQKVSDSSFSGVTAQKGWWISIPQVVMSNITSSDQVSMDGLGAIGGALFNTRVDITAKDLGQVPVDNCWGTLTFC